MSNPVNLFELIEVDIIS